MKKLFILIIAFFLTLFISCESEKEYITKDNSNQKLEIWKFPVGSVLKHKPELKNRIEKFKSKDNLIKKTSTIYNFSIEETEAQVIFKQEYTQYTFVVERENLSENILENYICKVYNDGQILQYLITYPVIENETETIYDGQNSTIHIIQDETIAVNIFGRGIRPGCTLELLSESWNYTCTNIACGGAGHDYGDDRCDCGITHDCTPASQECGWVGTFTYGCSNGNGNSNGNTNPGNNSGGSSGGGGSTNTTNPPTNPNPNDDLITVPLPGKDKVEIKLLNSFSIEQLNWWNNVADEEIKEAILVYVKNYLNLEQEEAIAFANEIAEQMRLNPELKLDIDDSRKSPAFVDMSSIDASTPEGAKFNEIYDALKTSPLFRSLFTDMFNQTPFINVKFKIEDIPQTSLNEHKNGTCKLYYYTDYSNLYNIITIDRNHLLHKSNLDIALTIIHEYIHAYLNVKFRIPSVGQPIPFSEINNKDLKDCINTYYNGFSGNQTQHSFFSDFMVPTIREILSNVKDILVSSQQANGVQNPTNGGAFLYYPLTNPPQLGQISDTYATWNWNTFFNYFAFNGLQNCTSYPYSKPTNQNHIFNNEEDFFRYYYISVYNTIFNQ